MSAKILIVDDDPVQRDLLEIAVRRCGHMTETAPGGEAALARLESAPGPGLVLLDLVMPDLDGLGVLARLRAKKIGVPVIALVAQGGIEAALSATRLGAVDFIVKPAPPERLQLAIKNALRLKALEDEICALNRRPSGALALHEAAPGAPMERVLRQAEKAAKSALPVLIEGEPGAGKETIARSIHEASERRGRPFVALRCAALAGAEAERALFGPASLQDAGAERRPGKLLEAHGGALYLDEIGALPLSAQARLVRALNAGEITTPGARHPLRADVRLFASTRQNLIELVKAGRFREDLYYRINMHPIAAPPLRQRRGEIEGLATGFCARFSAETGRRLRGLGAEALNLLSAYDWPGNIRQLENALFRAVVLAEGDELTVAEFPQIAAEVDGFDVRIPPPVRPAALREDSPPASAEAPEPRDPNALALLAEDGDMRRLDALEAEAIRFALVHYRGRISTMARKLGIGRSTLYRKMKEYDLPLAADEPGADDGGRESAA